MLKSCDIVSRALLLLAVAALAESLPPALPQYLLLGALVDRLYGRHQFLSLFRKSEYKRESVAMSGQVTQYYQVPDSTSYFSNR